MARANEDIERADAVAPRWFGRLPGAPCEVRPVEPFMERDAPPAYYYPPTIDGTRPGIYFVNTYDLPTRPLSELATTTYHEAVPGPPLPDRARDGDAGPAGVSAPGGRLVGSAYAEGWGLYSERLADEMGLYRNDAERFGMLEGQAWRAVRLIVDTGLHALGWSRERASSCSGRPPACQRPTRASRPTATSSGPARRSPTRSASARSTRLRASSPPATARPSTCVRSTMRCWVTAPCRSPRSLASCPAGWLPGRVGDPACY